MKVSMAFMPRVLLVSYTYPPGFGSGGIRISKFSKFLPEFGWEPVVLTVDPSRYPFRSGLECLVGKEEVVHTKFFDPLAWVKRFYEMESTPAVDGPASSDRARSSRLNLLAALFKPFRPAAKYFWDLIYFPDPQIGWYPYAVPAGRRIIESKKIDVVFSSSPPHTDHLIGAALAREFHLPWVADLRDPWSDQHTYRKYWPVSSFDRRLELRTMKWASEVITVSPTLANLLSEKLGRDVEVIENGFDPADLPPPEPPKNERGPFVLLHAGTLYRGQRDPRLLFEGVKILKIKIPLNPLRLQVHFVGVRSELAADLAQKHGVSDLVTVLPRESYPEVLKRQSRAAALLLLGVNDPMGGGVLTGKLFEYFGLRRPILGVGAPDADLEEILTRTRAGKFLTTAAAIAEVLKNWIGEYERSGTVPYQPDANELNKYTRRRAAEKLAGILSTAEPVHSPDQSLPSFQGP